MAAGDGIRADRPLHICCNHTPPAPSCFVFIFFFFFFFSIKIGVFFSMINSTINLVLAYITYKKKKVGGIPKWASAFFSLRSSADSRQNSRRVHFENFHKIWGVLYLPYPPPWPVWYQDSFSVALDTSRTLQHIQMESHLRRALLFPYSAPHSPIACVCLAFYEVATLERTWFVGILQVNDIKIW